MSVVLNLFRAVTHFEEPQIFVAPFRAVAHFRGPQILVAHFDYIFDVMMTISLRLASELMAAEVISKRKVIASPVSMMASALAESELTCKGK